MSTYRNDARALEKALIGFGFFVADDAKGSGTDSSQEVTINKTAGTITSSTTNLAADTSQTITVTNSVVDANSTVMCSVSGGGAGSPAVVGVVEGDGSFEVTVRNVDASNACDAAYKVKFIVF